MTNELSKERAIEALYTVRAYYASLTAGYPKGKDCRGIGDVMCSEIANSCLMAIKALEQVRWIPCSERLPEEDGDYLVTTKWKGSYSGDVYIETHVAYYRKKSKEWDCVDIIAWMPLPQPYKAEREE